MATASGDEIRLLIVEDVPQVAQYIRNLLTAQSAIKLLDVVTDGTKALHQIEQLRPDIVIVDALLQGRVKGMALVDQIRKAATDVPVVVLTVPQQPISEQPDKGVHGVLSMPFSGFDMLNKIQTVYNTFHVGGGDNTGQVVSVFAPKGGVGKTTIAFNLAVAIGQLDVRTVLIDGSLQFGDLRALLKVPVDAPSILDLPTDRIAESDLRDVLWRDPSGIDILLAPPRIEMAEMVSTRDVEKVLSLLRRVYQVIVIDMPAALSDLSLAFLDAADTIIEIVTYDSTTLRNTLAIADTFRAIGYPPEKVQLPDQPGRQPGWHVARGPATDPRPGADALGRLGRNARRAEQQPGRPVRARQSERADQPGHGAGRRRDHGPGTRRLLESPVTCRIRGPSGCSTRGSADSRCFARSSGGCPMNRRSISVTTAAPRTGPDPTTRSATSAPNRSTRWPTTTSRRSSSPATRRLPSRCRTCAAATTCRSSA